RFLAGVHHPAAGGLLAAFAAADADRLARDHAGHRVAAVHRVGVHHPGHDLSVGVHVGRRDVAIRTDHVANLGGEAAGHALQLAPAQRFGIARHAAFGAAVRDLHTRALPRHQHGQRADLVQVGLGMEANATLGRAARQVVPDAIASEDAARAVVELD